MRHAKFARRHRNTQPPSLDIKIRILLMSGDNAEDFLQETFEKLNGKAGGKTMPNS